MVCVEDLTVFFRDLKDKISLKGKIGKITSKCTVITTIPIPTIPKINAITIIDLFMI